MKKLVSHKKAYGNMFINLFIILILLPILVYQISFFNKIHPGIYVGGFNVGGMSKKEAVELLSKNTTLPDSIKLVNRDQVFILYPRELSTSYDYQAAIERAFSLTRSGNLIFDYVKRFKLFFANEHLGLWVNFDEEKFSKFISVISGQDSIEAVKPSVKLNKGRVIVSKGTPGKEVDQAKLRAEIENRLSFSDNSDVNIPIITVDPRISDLEVSVIKDRVEKYIGDKIEIKFEFQSYLVADSDIVDFLNIKGGYNDSNIDSFLNSITQKVNREPQNPRFSFEGGRVTEFQPALDGIIVDNEKFKHEFVVLLDKLGGASEKYFILNIPVDKTPPEITTDKVNDLGIKELIGRGTSTYYHSIPSRVHNVVLAASRINGTLVKPGETFSFNNTLGDVSQFTGYEQAYIISEGKTILGDGGGVCQVSTTLFRALLNAGLPITDRTAHAYRVGYYEQNSPPGIDATVYGPSPDLKFVNDTPGYILIEAFSDPRHYSLVFELYGTSDGRVATISKPVVSDVTPPPPDVYQDDPTLPIGIIKQIDFKAWGAKVTFKYKVVRSGETLINKTFTSNYRPWQAVYLRGVGSI